MQHLAEWAEARREELVAPEPVRGQEPALGFVVPAELEQHFGAGVADRCPDGQPGAAVHDVQAGGLAPDAFEQRGGVREPSCPPRHRRTNPRRPVAAERSLGRSGRSFELCRSSRRGFVITEQRGEASKQHQAQKPEV